MSAARASPWLTPPQQPGHQLPFLGKALMARLPPDVVADDFLMAESPVMPLNLS